MRRLAAATLTLMLAGCEDAVPPPQAPPGPVRADATTLNPRDRTARQQRVVLVTGPSGAGRSTAIRALEDLGFEVIDNLPLSLVPRLLDGLTRPTPVALGLDTRNRDFSAATVIDLIDRLTRDPAYACEVLFLDCGTERLEARYNETRRRHPLSGEGTPGDAIRIEQGLLTTIRSRAEKSARSACRSRISATCGRCSLTFRSPR